MSLDNVTLVWVVITVSLVIIVGALCYLLGQADGLREARAAQREQMARALMSVPEIREIIERAADGLREGIKARKDEP